MLAPNRVTDSVLLRSFAVTKPRVGSVSVGAAS